MDRISLICKQCGYTVEVFENELLNNTDCALCGEKMIYADLAEAKVETDNINEAIDKMAISNMEYEINTIGNQATFETVESMVDPKKRLQYREYFFKAGGKIPEIDLLEERAGKLYLIKQGAINE